MKTESKLSSRTVPAEETKSETPSEGSDDSSKYHLLNREFSIARS